MNIAIVGSGNVASHLNRALKPKAAVSLVNPHSLEGLPENVDVVIIAVADDAIAEVASLIPDSGALVVHTSGSVPIETLAPFFSKYGVLYPLQTFSKDIRLQYDEIPVFLEASSEETLSILKQTASLFTSHIRNADSYTRKILHLSAVFACNFANALIGIGYDILKENGIEGEVLQPLLSQTFMKLMTMQPEQAQTGPALRGDRRVIQSHLDILENQPELAEIYRLISDIIYRKKHLLK